MFVIKFCLNSQPCLALVITETVLLPPLVPNMDLVVLGQAIVPVVAPVVRGVLVIPIIVLVAMATVVLVKNNNPSRADDGRVPNTRKVWVLRYSTLIARRSGGAWPLSCPLSSYSYSGSPGLPGH